MATSKNPPRKKGKRHNGKRTDYRSNLERRVATQLDAAGIPYTYEKDTLPYIRNGKLSRYTPDFKVCGGVLIEAKGYFVGQHRDRHKMILVQAQHPERDIRFVFEREDMPIFKDSTFTYADWADLNGFLWSGGGQIPEDWITEFKSKLQ